MVPRSEPLILDGGDGGCGVCVGVHDGRQGSFELVTVLVVLGDGVGARRDVGSRGLASRCVNIWRAVRTMFVDLSTVEAAPSVCFLPSAQSERT